MHNLKSLTFIPDSLIDINEAAWTLPGSVKYFKLFYLKKLVKMLCFSFQRSHLYTKAHVAVTRLCTLTFDLKQSRDCIGESINNERRVIGASTHMPTLDSVGKSFPPLRSYDLYCYCCFVSFCRFKLRTLFIKRKTTRCQKWENLITIFFKIFLIVQCSQPGDSNDDTQQLFNFYFYLFMILLLLLLLLFSV